MEDTANSQRQIIEIAELLDEHLAEDTLALDVINHVGPAGNFLAEPHTLENFRKDIWYPSVFARDRFDNWKSKGGKDVLQRAIDRVKELLGDE